MVSIRQAPRQHWNMLEETSLQLMRTSSNDIRRGNMGTHHPSKEQASSRTNKDEKEYVKYHITGQISRQGTSTGYEITDGHHVLRPGNPTKEKDLEEDRRDVGETNETTTERVPSGRG